MSWTKESFLDILEAIGIIPNETIDFSGQEIIIRSNDLKNIEFSNCHIIANSLQFEGLRNNDLTIRFNNCTIDSELLFENCTIQGIYFDGTKHLKSLVLQKGFQENSVFEIEQFQFKDKEDLPNTLDCIFEFTVCNFKKEFSFYGLKHHSGTFQMIRNKFGIDDMEFENHNFMFQHCNLNNIWFFKNIFHNKTSFISNSFTRNTKGVRSSDSFTMNNFGNVSFKFCDFTNEERFTECEFNETANFEYIENINTGNLSLIDCWFKKHLTFNNTKLNNLSIIRSTFQHSASFQETSFNKIVIDQVNFEKGAYFDDIIIKEKRKTDRRTLRNIKQQLQKAENKIDYNRFRGYELGAYYRELKWRGDFKDKFILAATWLSTGFDHSWRRALAFTIVSGLLWYSVLYFSEYHGSYNPENINAFFTSAFRFFLVTDFSSPFKAKGEYLEIWWLWLPLILGKIVIAFGIYEMIQAFRKFKA